MEKLAVYNHGKDSSPLGEKAKAFGKVAKHHGYKVESPDYRKQFDPDKRVKQLLTIDFSTYERVVLIGSSMGGYVATVAAETIKPDGLFLLAPAFYLPGYQKTEFNLQAGNSKVFHGWLDDIVPPEHSWKFCQKHQCSLEMLNDGHRLINNLPLLMQKFDQFLAEIK